MMEHSLKLSKKIKPEWWSAREIFRRGAPPTALRASGPTSRTLPLSSRATRVVERTLARPLARAIACALLKSIPIDPPCARCPPPPFPPPSRLLARRSFALAPFRPRARNCARKIPDDYDVDHTAPPLPAAFAVVRPTDRPTALRFPCLNP